MARSKQQAQSRRAAEAAARRTAARRKRVIRNVAIGGGALALVAVALLVFRPGPAPTGVAAPEAWELPALSGDEVIALEDFAGKPTVAAFFASWCPHCQRELPGFAALSAELSDEVNWVGINTQDSGRGSGLARSSGIDAWPIARDVGGGDQRDLSTAFQARGMPLTVIYTPDGTVADVTRGAMTATTLRGKLTELFGVGG